MLATFLLHNEPITYLLRHVVCCQYQQGYMLLKLIFTNYVISTINEILTVMSGYKNKTDANNTDTCTEGHMKK